MKLISFDALMQLLRDRPLFLKEIEERKQLDYKIVSLLFSSSIFIAIYGAIIGSTHGWLQILSSAIKLPALYLLTLIICLPTLYFLDVILGSKRTFGQYIVLLLSCMALISVTLVGFAPVTFFFRLSMNDHDFFRLLNVIIFAFTGFVGVSFFQKAMLSLIDPESESSTNRRKLIKGWLFLYGFVGSQLGWTLRPFFSREGEPFALFRDIESNFYVEVLKIIGSIFGLN